MKFDAFVNDIESNKWNVFGTEVYENGLLTHSYGDTIETYEYIRCPDGYYYGASGTKLSVHDLSKIGLLLYNGGIYQGVRILSEEYVKLATSVQQMNREGGYGFYIWKYRDGFSINGKWKQKCYVLPGRGIIVTYLSHIEDDSHDLLDSMEKNILGV